MTVGVPETNLNSWGITYDVKKVKLTVGEEKKPKKAKPKKTPDESLADKQRAYDKLSDEEKREHDQKWLDQKMQEQSKKPKFETKPKKVKPKTEKHRKLEAAYDKTQEEKVEGGKWTEQPTPAKYTGQDAPAAETGGREGQNQPKFQKDPKPAKDTKDTKHFPSGEREGTTRAFRRTEHGVDPTTDAGKLTLEDMKARKERNAKARETEANIKAKKDKKIREGKEAKGYKKVVSDKETRERAPKPILGATDEKARQAKLQAERDSYARQAKLQGVKDSWRKTAVRGLPKRAIVKPNETDEGLPKQDNEDLLTLGRTREGKNASFDKIQEICNQILKVHFSIGEEGAKNLEAGGKRESPKPPKTSKEALGGLPKMGGKTSTIGSKFTSGQASAGQRKSPKPHIPFKVQDVESGKVEDVPEDVKVGGKQRTGSQSRTHVVGSKGKKLLEEKKNPDKPKVDLKQLKQLRDRITGGKGTEDDTKKLKELEQNTRSLQRQQQDKDIGEDSKRSKRFSHDAGQDTAPTKEEYAESPQGKKETQAKEEKRAQKEEDKKVVEESRNIKNELYRWSKGLKRNARETFSKLSTADQQAYKDRQEKRRKQPSRKKKADFTILKAKLLKVRLNL